MISFRERQLKIQEKQTQILSKQKQILKRQFYAYVLIVFIAILTGTIYASDFLYDKVNPEYQQFSILLVWIVSCIFVIMAFVLGAWLVQSQKGFIFK